ncbi:MAG TPA: hypothetical protein VFW75_16495 [Acetobacteraceae bacterium]|nr:hypothetical protein [Acetobacteraceae bacterium]
MADSVTQHVHHHHHIHHHYQVPTMPGNQQMDRYARRFMQPDNRTANYAGPGATYWQQFPISPFFQAAQGGRRQTGNPGRSASGTGGQQIVRQPNRASGTSYYGGYSRGYAYPSGGGYYGGFGYPTYGDVG